MRTLDFEDMWKYAKIKGYETYVMEVTTSDTVPILLLTQYLFYMWKYAKIKGYETYVMQATTSDTVSYLLPTQYLFYY